MGHYGIVVPVSSSLLLLLCVMCVTSYVCLLCSVDSLKKQPFWLTCETIKTGPATASDLVTVSRIENLIF